jgi:tetratricopeptide (TPR) repeat protein
MAERIEEPESEADQVAEPVSPAAGIAIGLRKGRSRDKADPKLDAFLDRQTRLIELQTEHLHEQRLLVLSRLRWGRFSDRMKALLQVMTACLGLAVAGGVAWMAWSASQDRALVIEPFSVPPDLAQKGLTGQVVASMLLDKLAQMQNATVSSRAPSTYANDWSDQIKVEIPETGVSVGELQRLLVQWLGRRTSISGELYRTPAGLALAARAGTAPAGSHAGQEADIDAMVQAAAEDVYATTQPYRYANWLGRSFDAASIAKKQLLLQQLAAGGDRTDRLWANTALAAILTSAGDFRGATDAADAAIRLEPKFGVAYLNRATANYFQGHEGAAMADGRMAIAMFDAYGRRFLTAEGLASNRSDLRSYEDGDMGDFGAAARDEAQALQLQPDDFIRANLASVEAFGHDLAAARATGAQFTRPDPTDTSLPAAFARAGPAEADAMVSAQLEDWTSVKAALERIDPTQFPPGFRTFLLTRFTPYLALARAKLGDIDGARSLIATTPVDCYLCVRMRGRIEAAAHNWPEAERWLAEAVRLGPSIPFPHVDRAQLRLAQGDPDGALAELKLAIAKGPHFADAYELQGEALLRKRDFAGAAKAFAQGDAYAPKWGRSHLMWGEALMLSGRYAKARRQYETASSLDLSKLDRVALNVLLARTASGPLHG